VFGACLFIGMVWTASAVARPTSDAPVPVVEAQKPTARPAPIRLWDPGALLRDAMSAAVAAAPPGLGVAAPKLPRLQPPVLDLVYAVGAAVFALSVLGLLVVRGLLVKSPGWSLGDALSEEADLTNDQGTPIKVMRASASRLIAFSGLLVMLFLYFGFGMFLLYYFGTGQKVPQDVLDGIQKFMMAGLALFAPYALNQVRAAMNKAAPAAPTVASPPPAPAVGQTPLKQLQAPAAAAATEETFLGGC
jgi:hypothetical protein